MDRGEVTRPSAPRRPDDAIGGLELAIVVITTTALAIGLVALHRIVLSTSACALVTDNARLRH